MKKTTYLIFRKHPKFTHSMPTSFVDSNFATKMVVRQSYRSNHEEHELSCLYVSGRRASQTFAAINPTIDFGSTLLCEDKLKELRENMTARSLSTDHLNQLAEDWLRYQQLLQKENSLQEELLMLRKKLRVLSNESNNETLKILGDRKMDCQLSLKNIHFEIWNLEDTVLVSALHLPNKLENSSNITQIPTITMKHGEKPRFDFKEETHMSLGKLLKMIQVKNVGPASVYFRGNGANLEQAVLSYFSDQLRKLGMQQVSGPHICKTVVAEGIHVVDTMDPDRRIILEDVKKNLDVNKLQLVGGSSMESLCAILTKCMIDHTSLPFKLFGCGRHYKMVGPSNESSDLNLFSLPQSTGIHYLVASQEEGIQQCYEDALAFFIKIYKHFNVPFIVSQQPAHKISLAESNRTSIQLWSPSQNQYMECAWISFYDDFVSKRLIMRYRDQQGKHFLHLLSGCAVDFPILFACLLENNQSECRNFSIPEVLLPYFVKNT